MNFGECLPLCKLEACRHDINDVADLIGLAVGLHFAGPAHDEWGADAALVHPAFVATKRRILRPAPRRTDGGVGANNAGLLGVVATTRFLGAAAVVGEKHDDGVVSDS